MRWVVILLALSVPAFGQDFPEFDYDPYCKIQVQRGTFGSDMTLAPTVCSVSEKYARGTALGAWETASDDIRRLCLLQMNLTKTGMPPSYAQLGACLVRSIARSTQGPGNYTYYPPPPANQVIQSLTLPECSALARDGGTCIAK
jgi:hypothetical protein